METKVCTKCNVDKFISEYSSSKRGLYGVRSYCKVCSCRNAKEYHRTKAGLISLIYRSQNGNSKQRGHPKPNYSLSELRGWCFSQPLFHELFDDWFLFYYDKNLTPSIDRINNYKSYVFSNIQLMTWYENNRKGNLDIRNGIITHGNKPQVPVMGKHKGTGKIIQFHSQAEASRKTGIRQGDISSCCSGRYKSAGGYVWRCKK